MLKLEDIRKDAVIQGIDPTAPVTIRFVEQIGPDALNVNYRLASGDTRERMLMRHDEANLSVAVAGRPWAFDADPEAFKLAVEAWRINVAHLFDPMMAIHTSNVEPLPHQITAVYESMLPRQPLRYVLADDPGSGKTIMAGLLVRELIMRADAKRVLIVAPGSLVEQWQDEMDEKFGLDFKVFGRDMIENSRGGNPFEDFDLLVARVDQLARNDDLREKLALSHWDLIIVDEAHKLSANYFGTKVNKTRRFELGELLGRISRHFLLMTATPHNGKEEDFQLWLSLIDGDRFYGNPRDGVHQVDVNDLMRRMAGAIEWVLDLQQSWAAKETTKDGKRDAHRRYQDAVLALSKAYALASASEEARELREEVGFFQAVREALVKSSTGAGASRAERDLAIQQIVSRAVVSTEIVDILAAAGIQSPDISILSDQFLAEVQQMERKNLALEALRKLLNDGIRSRSKSNVVQTKAFSERLEDAVARYHANAVTTAEVLQELIQLARDIRAARERGEEAGLTDEEIAFYDALAESDSAVQAMGDEKLRVIAHELLKSLRENASVDWAHREAARARMRVLVKRILRKYGYPPDLQDKAVQTVLQQAEALSASWTGG